MGRDCFWLCTLPRATLKRDKNRLPSHHGALAAVIRARQDEAASSAMLSGAGSRIRVGQSPRPGIALPSLYFSGSPYYKDFQADAGIYLKEEIAAEAVVRNLSAFSRFLTVAALCNGQLCNYSKIVSDAQVPKSTVQEYCHILHDILLGDDLPVLRWTEKRKPPTTAKFYFFDVGIVRHLQRRQLQEGSPEFGEAFEAYLHHEQRVYCDYDGGWPWCADVRRWILKWISF